MRSRKSKDKQHNGQMSEGVMLSKFNSLIIHLCLGDFQQRDEEIRFVLDQHA